MNLTLEETKLLYDFLKYQFISYEKLELAAIVRKIRVYLDDELMDELSNESIDEEIFNDERNS